MAKQDYKDLYQQVPIIKKENEDIFKKTPDQKMSGEVVGTDYNKFDPTYAVPLTPENRSPYDYAGKYSAYVPNIGSLSAGVDVGSIRAGAQSGWEQAFNVGKRALPNIILGTVSNLAAIADVEDWWNIDDEVGNPISNWADSLKETLINANTPIYRQDPNKSFDITDSGYIWDNVSMLIDSAGAFAATGLITGGLLGAAAKTMRAESFVANLEQKYGAKAAKLLANGEITAQEVPAYVARMRDIRLGTYPTLFNAAALNQAEGIMEGAGVYKDVLRQKMDEGLSYDEARQAAADAASLDVNINRVNFFTNLTSAGLFTKGGKAIKEALGGAGKTIAVESAQEAAEEGVNYIAQMEAMQQAKDGANYTFDPGRAMAHLGTIQGAEAMVLGALGGAANTVFTEGLMHGRRAKEDLIASKNRLMASAGSQKQKDNVAILDAELKKHNQLLNSVDEDVEKNAYTRAMESINVDSSTSKPNTPSTGQLDRDIESFNIVLNSPVSSAQQKVNAQKAIDAAEAIKRVALDPSHNNIWGTKNASEVISKKMALDELSARTVELSAIASVINSNDKLNDSAKEAALRPINDELAILNTESETLSKEYSDLIKSTPKAKEATTTKTTIENNTAENKKTTATKAKQQSAAERTVKSAKPENIPLKQAGKSIRTGKKFNLVTWNGESNDIADVAPIMHRTSEREDKIKYSAQEAEFEMGYEEANDIVGEDLTADENKSSALVFDSVGNAYGIYDNKTKIDATITKDDTSQYGETTKTKIVPAEPKIKKLSKIVGGEKQFVKGGDAVKLFLSQEAVDTGTDKTIRIGDSKFTREDLVNFIDENIGSEVNYRKSADIRKAIESIPEDKITDFVRSNLQRTIELADNGFNQSILLDDINEPAIQNDDKVLTEAGSNKSGEFNGLTVRTVVNAVAFQSVPWVKNEVTGKYEDAGVANEEFVANSVSGNINPGDEIIFEAYDGKPIPMNQYDADGNVITENKNGKIINVKKEYNASSLIAEGRTDIPIAIYHAKGGRKGKLIGYLNDDKYLNEKRNGKYIHFVSADNNIAEQQIDNIRKIREKIVNLYKNNAPIATLRSSIISVGTGALRKSVEPSNISEVGGKSPRLGYIYGGIAKDGHGNTIDVANKIDGVKNGTPVIYAEMANGELFAVPSFSKTLGDMKSADGSYSDLIVNGIVSHILKNNASVDSFDQLKAYIQQFVFVSSKNHIDSGGDASSYVMVNEDFIEWRNGSLGEKIPFSVLRGLKKDVPSLQKKLSKFLQYLNTQKVNYNKDILSAGLPVNGIKSDGRFTTIAGDGIEFYKNTLATTYRPLSIVNGEPVWAASPVIEFNTDFINDSSRAELVEAVSEKKKAAPKVRAPKTSAVKREKVKIVKTIDYGEESDKSIEGIILSDNLLSPTIDESSIFGFPSSGDTNIIDEFIADELDNPEVISTSAREILTSEEKAAGIQSIVLAVDKALSGSNLVNIGDALKSAKSSLTALSRFYEKRASQISQDTDLGVATILTYNKWIESLNRVRDRKAWNGIVDAAIDYLSANGIDITSNNSSDISDIHDGEENIDNAIDGFSSEDSGNGWNITDSFYRDPKSYSTIRIKSMLASLVDVTQNVLGMAPLFDQGEAYRKVMRIVSLSTKRGHKDIMQSLQRESDNVSAVIPNNIYKQLLDKLSKATLQEKIQFKVATNMQRNVFLLTLFDPTKPGDTKIINAQVRDAHKLILNEWQSRLRYILQSSGSPKQYATSLASGFSEIKSEIAKEKDANKKRILLATYARTLLGKLGVSLESESWSELVRGDKTLYNKKNQFDLGRTNFISQIEDHGMFDTLNKTLSNIKDEAELDDVVDVLNQGFVRFLATLESKHNKRYMPENFRGLDGNKRYNYSLMTPIADAVNKFKSDKSEVDKLKGTIYSGHSYLLNAKHFGEKNTTDFSDSFELTQNYAIKDVKRKRQKENKDMSDADSIFSRLQLFANATRNGVADEAVIVGHTHSDKTLNVSIQARRTTINASLFDANGNLTEPGRNSLLESKEGLLSKCMSIVYGEAERMIAMSTASGKKLDTLKKEYGNHIIDNAQFFYGYAFLNQYLTFDKNLRLTNDANGIGKLDMSNPINEKFWKEKVLDYFIEQADSDEKYWESIGLITKDKFGQYNVTPVPNGYAKSKGLYGKVSRTYNKGGVEASMKTNGITNHRKAIKMLSLEANMNTAAVQSGFAMITSGDIANSSKNANAEISKYLKAGNDLNTSIMKGVDVILSEHLGRLAADVAPAQNVEEEYEFTDSKGNVIKGAKTYKILIINDAIKSGEEYAQSVAELVKQSIPKNFKATDGLEYVTVQHKLDSLFRVGKINENDYIRILNKYNSGGILSEDDLKYFTIGAGKPRQVYEKQFTAGSDTYIKRVYIKSSEIALIKQVTETFSEDLDDLRQMMEKNGIDRLVHTSAVKLGNGEPSDVYTKDGGVIDEKKFIKASKAAIEMNWSGFGYQLELPNKSGEPVVTNVSQADANILEGTDDIEFDYRGEKITGKQLKNVKHSINRNLSELEEDDIDRELGVVQSGDISPVKVFSAMDSGRSASGLSENDVSSVYHAVKNSLPLLLTNIPRQVESFIFSKYRKTIKLLRPGTMLPQYPSIGKTKYKGGTIKNLSSIDGLLKTRSFDPSRELAMTKVIWDNDGNPQETIVAECTLPWKIWGKGGLVDIKSLIETEGEFAGFIDPKKLPDNLLKIVGMRTPNEGHSTQIMLKVVAFTPKVHGDLMYVPTEITLQMGSDYDIDKLTAYWRNMIQANNGNMVSTPDNAISINKANGDIKVDMQKVHKWINKHFNVSSISDENIARLQTELFDSTQSGNILTSAGIEEFIEEENKDDARKLLYKMIQDGDESVLESVNKLGREIYLGPSVRSVVKKIYEDAYFDIFNSVLSHPQIASKSMTPLDSDDLRDLAKVEEEQQEIFPWFSLRRQSNEYVKRQSTKKGINVFAKENSSMNGAENNTMKVLDENGKTITFSKFGGISLDTLDAGGISDYQGNPRTGKKNIAIQLSGALDDRKYNALEPNGLANSTFGISGAISSLTNADREGLSLEYNTYFLKQRAIRRVVRMMKLGSSVMAPRELSQNRFLKNAIETVREKYLSPLSEDARVRVLDQVEKLKSVTYYKEDLLSLLKQSKTDNTSEDYIARQLDMLNILEDLKVINDSMFQLTSQTTMDSQGFRSTYMDNLNALNNASKIGESKVVSNSALYLSTLGTAKVIDGVMTMADDNDRLTTTGNNVRLVAEKLALVKRLMGYDAPFISNAIDKISAYTKTNDVSDTYEYVKAAKSFIYAKLPMFSGYSIKTLTNGSLVSEMMRIKGLPEMSNNMFIRSLEASRDMKYVSIAAIPGDSIAGRKIRDGFRDLLLSANPELSGFANKMIAYEFLSGGSQHASNSIKYIPNSYLNRVGFYNQVKVVFEELNNNPIGADQLLKLYLQNNPDDIRFSGQGLATYNKTSGSITIKVDDIGKDAVGDPLRYIKIKGDHYMQLNDAKSAKTKEADGTLIYDTLPLKGGLSDKKAINNLINDYSSDGDPIIPSIVDSTKKSVPIINLDEIASHEEFMTSIDSILNAPFEIGADNLIDLVKTIDTPYSNWMVGAMEVMRDDLNGVGVVAMSKNTSAIIAGSVGAGSYNVPTNTISLNVEKLNNVFKSTGSSQFVKEIVLHELAHAMQISAYRKGLSGDKRYSAIYRNVNTIFEDSIKQVKDLGVISSVTGTPLIGINGTRLTYGMFTNSKGLSYTNKNGTFTTIDAISKQVYPDVYGRDNSAKRDELKFSLYMFSSREEFMAEVASKQHVQNLLGSVSLTPSVAKEIGSTGNKSILRAFLDQMAKFISGLNKMFLTDNNGNKVAKNSVLEAMFVQNSLLFGNTGISEDVAGETLAHPSVEAQQLPGTVREYLQNADRDTRAGFRYALNNGLVKTKC